jgi:hypothetical protein
MHAAPPSPAKAGCAAQRAESLARDEEVYREERRAGAIGRLLRAGKSPEEIAAQLSEPLEFVLMRKALRDANPMVRSSRKGGSA